MDPIIDSFVQAANDPDTRCVVVHPEDYVQHLRENLGDQFTNTSNQGTLLSGCVGVYKCDNGKLVTVYVRKTLPKGSVRAGNLSVLTGL